MEIKNKLIDPFGRDINYLRVSVTDRCDFRCTYCMAEDMKFLPKKDVLSLEEIEDTLAIHQNTEAFSFAASDSEEDPDRSGKIELQGAENNVDGFVFTVIN